MATLILAMTRVQGDLTQRRARALLEAPGPCWGGGSVRSPCFGLRQLQGGSDVANFDGVTDF